MPQRLSASAEAPGRPAAGAQPPPDPPGNARRRAADYLDLWERQLVQAAARGWGEPAEEETPRE